MNLTNYFTTNTRNDGTSYVTWTPNAPDWIKNAAMQAHAEELPNDWRYATYQRICELLDEIDDPSEDDAYEISEEIVEIETLKLLEWVSGNLNRISYVDEALHDSCNDFASALMIGQLTCIEEMARILIDARLTAEHEAFFDDADEMEVC